jgi:hypothetical protein
MFDFISETRIGRAARIAAAVLSKAPEGAITYAPIGVYGEGVEDARSFAYVSLQGPGAVAFLQTLRATNEGWRQNGSKPAEEWRNWTVAIEGVSFEAMEARDRVVTDGQPNA